jgi:quercetin dioxygenase-like cupin family protein
MRKFVAYPLLALCTVGVSAFAYAQSDGTGVLKLPQDIEFKSPLTGPPQTIVLYGDPTKPGVFVSRAKFSAGWKDPPHWHPDEVRTVVVLSGTLYFGSGDKWDESKFKAYPAGTFYSEPSKAPHFSWRRTVR